MTKKLVKNVQIFHRVEKFSISNAYDILSLYVSQSHLLCQHMSGHVQNFTESVLCYRKALFELFMENHRRPYAGEVLHETGLLKFENVLRYIISTFV